KEDMIRAVEDDIVQEKQAAQNIIQKMSADKQAKYTEMKATNEELLQDLVHSQAKQEQSCCMRNYWSWRTAVRVTTSVSKGNEPKSTRSCRREKRKLTNLNRLQQLSAVTAQELRSMQEDLSFKETEMQKSQSTAKGLSSESERLQQDLLKVEQLESKVSTELQTLRDQLKLMKQEIHTYRDLDALKAAGEDRKKRLQEDRVTLTQRKDTFKKIIHNMNEEYESLKNQLQENETHVELTNMERKWQHLEQNNFVMKEFIASKGVESDYRPVMKNVNKQLLEYNKILVDTLQRN
ncbi:hypothetical protein cypCar_00011167, partial [Cyprinus carpio]